jgi:hypothetical protein
MSYPSSSDVLLEKSSAILAEHNSLKEFVGLALVIHPECLQL